MAEERPKLVPVTREEKLARSIAHRYFDKDAKYGDKRFWHLVKDIKLAIAIIRETDNG